MAGEDGNAGVAAEKRTWPAMLAMLAALAAWLWPIGVGGRMPVGGDATQFQIGLMAVLARAIRAGRLPLWNDLWGYGFPGVGESQMGVFYPPHGFLYGLLSTEAAYTASLVLHTAWGALGAAWAARRFGVSAWGSALSGFAWAASGFFVIHLPHQWGYTVGSWMPWACGLAWPLARGAGDGRDAWKLAVVLAVQLLPGHFQLAFETQVGLLGMALWGVVARPSGGRRAARGCLAILLALGAAVPLAAVQLGPTWRLARLAATQRDFEYLSGFAATPLHLVSYLAPGLFHRSSLWRASAWDLFHTSPEEHLTYIGLAPLLLAMGAIRQGFRRDAAVRLLTGLAVGSLALSLGPYLPGFRQLIQLPGFSFFRAAARWGVATELALAILAGKGFDSLPAWPRPGRSLARFAVLAVAAPALALLLFEGALASTNGSARMPLAGLYQRAVRMLPWAEETSFRDLMIAVRQPQADTRVLIGLAREGYDPVPLGGLRLDRERFAIYGRELRETGLVLLGLLALFPMAQRSRVSRFALLALTVADLWMLGRTRGVDDGPIRPLTDQSRVLARLAAEPRGTRLVAGIGNLPMVAGAATVSYYRTMDVPAVPFLARTAIAPLGPPGSDAVVAETMRATGAIQRLLDPYEAAALASRGWEGAGTFERINDPALASWNFGRAWVQTRGARTTYALWRPGIGASRAWLLPASADPAGATPDQVLGLLRRAAPLTWRAPDPEHLEVDVKAERPGWVVLSVLFDPEWRGGWVGPAGGRPAEVVRALGGWQAVRVPAPGVWTLRLGYRGQDVIQGAAISTLAWSLAIGLRAMSGRRRRTRT